MPKRAATPVPAMIAAGVARPSAHGQAITNTETARKIAIDAESKYNQLAIPVMMAITITVGTKMALT